VENNNISPRKQPKKIRKSNVNSDKVGRSCCVIFWLVIIIYVKLQ
jgi:hypothetical protein